MQLKIIFSIILSLIAQFAFCQSEKLIHGKITVKDGNPQGVHITNLGNEKETICDEKGEFNILAKTDDVLLFSSKHLNYQRKTIEQDDYKAGSIKIEMTLKVTQLEEVKIAKPIEFDPRILSHPAKKLTRTERHLKTAGDFKPIHLLAILGGTLPLDPIINAVNGKTKKIKKELVVEREASLLTTLRELFDDEYYTRDLKINPDYIKGFQYYAVKNNNLAQALPAKNKAIIQFILVQLAFEYNNLQQVKENTPAEVFSNPTNN